MRHRGWQDSLPAMSGIVSLTRSAPRPTKAGQGQSGCVSIFRKSTIGFLMFLILSHTSVCFPIHQVVRGKHHRIKKLEARHRGWRVDLHAGFWHCPSHPVSPQAHESRTGAERVCIHQWVSDVLNCPLRVGLDSRCMFRFFDL